MPVAKGAPDTCRWMTVLFVVLLLFSHVITAHVCKHGAHLHLNSIICLLPSQTGGFTLTWISPRLTDSSSALGLSIPGGPIHTSVLLVSYPTSTFVTHLPENPHFLFLPATGTWEDQYLPYSVQLEKQALLTMLTMNKWGALNIVVVETWTFQLHAGPTWVTSSQPKNILKFSKQCGWFTCRIIQH